MKSLMTICMALILSGIAQAAPIEGIFDSRIDSSIGATFWEDDSGVWGFPDFSAYGMSGTSTQWYIEAHDLEYYGWAGYVQLNNGPWLGDDPAVVGGYEGNITGWTLTKDWSGEMLDLVMTGSAVLDKKHLMPWDHWAYEDMAPVTVNFEVGFSGIPEYGTPETYSEGAIFGTPDYVVFTIPEPVTIALFSLGSLVLLRRKR